MQDDDDDLDQKSESGDEGKSTAVDGETARKCIQLSQYLCQLSVLVLPLQNYKASIVAAACVYTSRRLLKITPIWNRDLEKLTLYKFEEIKE